MCAAAGCPSPVGDHGAKGYCPKHYKRLKRRGDVGFEYRASAPIRFARFENRSEPDECWEWRGRQDQDGYGTIHIGNAPRRAHRYAWELTNGRIPAGLHVLHHCDNPPCVNPAHLFLGTVADNNRDKMMKGRHRANPDPWACRRRLSDEQVAEIRAFGNPYYGARAELARRYGVSHQHIRAIQLGERR